MVVSDLSEIGSVDTDCEGRLCGDICEYTQRLWNNTEQKNGLCNEEGRCHGAMVQCGMNTFSRYFLVIFDHIFYFVVNFLFLYPILLQYRSIETNIKRPPVEDIQHWASAKGIFAATHST